MSTNTRDVATGLALAVLAAEWPRFDWRSPRHALANFSRRVHEGTLHCIG